MRVYGKGNLASTIGQPRTGDDDDDAASPAPG